jgi:hypothetical protein
MAVYQLLDLHKMPAWLAELTKIKCINCKLEIGGLSLGINWIQNLNLNGLKLGFRQRFNHYTKCMCSGL